MELALLDRHDERQPAARRLDFQQRLLVGGAGGQAARAAHAMAQEVVVRQVGDKDVLAFDGPGQAFEAVHGVGGAVRRRDDRLLVVWRLIIPRPGCNGQSSWDRQTSQGRQETAVETAARGPCAPAVRLRGRGRDVPDGGHLRPSAHVSPPAEQRRPRSRGMDCITPYALSHISTSKFHLLVKNRLHHFRCDNVKHNNYR